MLPKFTEMVRNWIIFTPHGFIKNLKQIYVRDSHAKFTRKINSAIPRKQNYTPRLVKNGKTVFNKLTRKISLTVSGEHASKHWPVIFLSQIFSFFSSLLGCYFSRISCDFYFGLIFNEFLTITFEFYWNFGLQLSW